MSATEELDQRLEKSEKLNSKLTMLLSKMQSVMQVITKSEETKNELQARVAALEEKL